MDHFPDQPPSVLTPHPSPHLPEPRHEYPNSSAFTPESQQQDADSGGLLEYWRIIRRRKGTVILLTFIGALIGFVVTLPQTPVFQAHTSVEIVGLNDSFLN